MRRRYSKGQGGQRRGVAVSAVALALAAASGSACATDVFRLEGFGAVSRSMGGAATAFDTGPAGMMTNPATLSLMQTDNAFLLGVDLVTTDIDVRNQSTGESVSSSNHSANHGP
ncbi:MAG: hypothetical protein EKK49_07220, partial [Rhodocyclaceae bacterium]